MNLRGVFFIVLHFLVFIMWLMNCREGTSSTTHSKQFWLCPLNLRINQKESNKLGQRLLSAAFAIRRATRNHNVQNYRTSNHGRAIIVPAADCATSGDGTSTSNISREVPTILWQNICSNSCPFISLTPCLHLLHVSPNLAQCLIRCNAPVINDSSLFTSTSFPSNMAANCT